MAKEKKVNPRVDFLLRIPPELMKEVNDYSKKLGITKTELIKIGIERLLRDLKKEDKK
ncbi:MAG: ribbon-helix-helix domain-containing protein [Candidatus Desulfofervidus auxilii]|nr:ribbon-helix-helix domain-containing protein [Candidatus Desulfofervidus auxilii]